jgi:low temperature requirement protein LtrA
LLLLGEAIIQLVQYTGGVAALDYTRAMLGFAVVFNVGDIYYQQQLLGKQVMQERGQKVVRYSWMSLHLFLSMSILFFAVGVKLVYQKPEDLNTDREEYLMCIFAAVTLGFIYVLRMDHKGHLHGSSFRYSAYLFRFTGAGLCALLPLFTTSPTQTIGALFAVTSVLVLQVCAQCSVPLNGVI